MILLFIRIIKEPRFSVKVFGFGSKYIKNLLFLVSVHEFRVMMSQC